MAEAPFPTTSTHIVDLKSTRYDTAQLMAIVDEKFDKKKLKPSSTVEIASPIGHSSPSLFHLHTLTIDVTLSPPPEHLYFWGQNPSPNPEYQAYLSIREKVCSTVDPLSPVSLMPPTRRMLRNPSFLDKGLGLFRGVDHDVDGRSVLLYLPSSHDKRPLARLPALSTHVAQQWAPNSKAWDMQHWLHAAVALDPEDIPSRSQKYRDRKERFFLDTSAQLLWLPGEDGGTDLKLIVTTDVSVDMETLVSFPLPDLGREMIGLVLHSLVPTSTPYPNLSESEARAAALRRFFDGLKPASDLPYTFNVKTLQPKEMKCQLLPFQTRTLGLLLRREGSYIVPDTKPWVGDPRGFWEVLDFGAQIGRMAYRRVTGDLVRLEAISPSTDTKGKGKAVDGEEDIEVEGLSVSQRRSLPHVLDLSSVKGTMLCEEMGLGKTVEAIALTLLHRHPRSVARDACDEDLNNPDQDSIRNAADGLKPATPPGRVPVIDLLKGVPDQESPRIREWIKREHAAFQGLTAYDPVSQLKVTEVAATLIVTPPSLLKQWVSEIRRHSPYIRVCVYEGWKSLQKGIERQHAAAVRANRQAIEGKKRKAADNFRKDTVKKYQRLNGGGAIKVESDGEEEDEAVLQEESSLEICQRQFVEYVRAHDVVITTYNDLSADLKVALPAPPRSRRSNANYKIGERPRSPLIMVEWWRVIMDEVQLHSDQSGAANMVSHIPRVHALAMSGTPAKNDVGDLMGSLRFLRVPVLPQSTHLWHRLQQAPMQEAFEGIFRQLAVRTTKREVAGEFSLPSQTRLVVPIELSEIEMHYYNDTLDRQRDLLHLPAEPWAQRPADWRLDRPLFRACLKNLRQICTHIQVGQMQQQHIARGPRLHLGRDLMTMAEALQKMRDDHAQELLIESRVQMRALIRQGQLMILDETDDNRHRSALNLYRAARDKVDRQLVPIREHLQKLLSERTEQEVEADEAHDTPPRNMSQHERERNQAIQIARIAVREMLILQHQTWFFEGDVHHVLKDQDSEIQSYAAADATRKEILARPLEIANKSISELQKSLERSRAVEAVSDLQVRDTDMRGGILTSGFAEQANELLKILNGNAELLFAWRRKIIELLSSPIDTEGDVAPLEGKGTDVEDPEAEYYAQALQAQGDVEAYLIAYAAIVADRKEFMVEDRRNLLAEHDGRVKKLRTTRAAHNALVDGVAEVQGEVAEQAALLMAERQAFRHARELKDCMRPLKGIVMDMNPALLGDSRPEEKAIARMLTQKLKSYIDTQMERHEKLSKELDVFRAIFNKRVKYFSALQEISDSVTAPEFKNLADDITETRAKVIESETKLARMTVKGRFLQYLSSKEDGADELREECIICLGSSDDKNGVLLECGHFFCRSCFRELRRARQRNCPSCRTLSELADAECSACSVLKAVNDRAITNIKLGAAKAEAKEESAAQASSADGALTEAGPSSQAEVVEDKEAEVDLVELESRRREADLAKIKYLDVERRREVAHLDMMGEYGSKINFLIKHLLWYRFREPDARHVIFSNWFDSLNIVMNALQANGIGFVSFDQSGRNRDAVERFKNDPTISVFLLHAERESSGLTLTSCRVVHLLEPVLRHSFELQAIGRVDRLGQDKETTVFCYATTNTVESRILAQGVRNGTSIYLKDEAGDEIVADMPNVVSAAHKGGDLASDGNEEELLKLIT